VNKSSKIIIIFVIIILGIITVWLSLDKVTKCNLIYGKNICNFYAMMGSSNFDEMMNLCKDMDDVPKKDSCFEFIAQTFAQTNTSKAKEACDQIKGFENVHTKEHCYNLIKK